MLPDWFLRRMTAFILGFALMCIYLATREVMAGHFWQLVANGL